MCVRYTRKTHDIILMIDYIVYTSVRSCARACMCVRHGTGAVNSGWRTGVTNDSTRCGRLMGVASIINNERNCGTPRDLRNKGDMPVDSRRPSIWRMHTHTHTQSHTRTRARTRLRFGNVRRRRVAQYSSNRIQRR